MEPVLPSPQPEIGKNKPDGKAISEETAQLLAEERQRISRLLHDDILQAFAVCLLKSQYCERLAVLGRHDQVAVELGALQASLNEAIDQVRALSHTLRKPSP